MQIRIRHLYRAAPETSQGAMHAFAVPIENMGIDPRGFDIVVAQEFLYGSDIILEIYTAEVRFTRRKIFYPIARLRRNQIEIRFVT
jgi:hypothetical protein